MNKDDNGMLQGLDKLTIINELIRLGKIEMKDFITNLRRKYSIGIDAEFKAWLATILREVAEVTEQGGANYLQIKEKYKRSMPSHGERVDFQSR